MKPQSRKLVAIVAVLALCLASVAAGRAFFGPQGKWAADRRNTARSQGDPKAQLWIVEYFDYQCRACREAKSLIRDYMERHPGGVYLQLRFYPLIRQDHRYGVKSAIYAECSASQGKFWPFHELLFEKQELWSISEDPDALFHEYAREAGLDGRKLTACVDDPATKKRVLDEKAQAMDLGVNLTPTFFVNGRMVAGLEAIREELQ